MDDLCFVAPELLIHQFHRHRPTNCLFHQANVEASTNVDLPINPQV